ncbi:DUF2079 domain-containing protein [Kitasatospora sp. NPDC048540]|uniref:DUF2079 domain-containing protein n=1 Tax=Kitasatospora sp. NPDC048540 TaxID=3155634 RepID=UPI00068F8962
MPHLLLGLLFFVVYAVIGVIRHVRYASMSWDLAIFVQEVRQYASLHAPVVSVKGPGYNILGDHFSPVLALLAPAYRVFPTPVTLLVAQAALFASSIPIVSSTAAAFVSRSKSLAVGVAYGLSWGLQRGVDFDFHEICFAVPLSALALRNIILRRWYRAAAWAAALVLVKEDMGMTVVAIALVLILLRQYALGAVLAAFGTGMLILTVKVVIPHFNPNGHYDYASKLRGGSSTGAPLDLVHGFLFTEIKLQTLGYLLLITAFLALRSPLVLVAVPTLLWRFASSDSAYWGMDWHYNAVLMPVLFLALIDAVRRCEAYPTPVWLRAYATQAVVPAVTAISLVLCPAMGLPVAGLFMPSTYARNAGRLTALRTAVATVPDGATVEANVPLLAHLAPRTTPFWIGTAVGAPRYVALDLSTGWSDPPESAAGYGESLHPGVRYAVVFDEQHVQVAKRVD